MPDETPICRHCQAELTGENWTPSGRRYDDKCCRACGKVISRAWYLANRGKVLPRVKAWARANPDKVRSYRDKRKGVPVGDLAREKKNSLQRAWRAAHPEKAREYRRKAYYADLERSRAYQRSKALARRRADPEAERAKVKAWAKSHPEAYFASRSRSKARNRGLIRATAYEAILPSDIFERDRWRCGLCKGKTPKELQGTLAENAPTLDHIIPLKLGGPHTKANLRCLCRKCNCAMNAHYEGQLAFA